MSNQLHNELKKEFQLERLILFSDAVFAIAITLLVIEIKIPDKEFLKERGGLSDATILNALSHLVPKFIGFFISFLLIGLYWSIHHRMFGFVTSYDRKLLFLNLLFLFFGRHLRLRVVAALRRATRPGLRRADGATRTAGPATTRLGHGKRTTSGDETRREQHLKHGILLLR